ncbi:MAG: glycosyltransferase family 4 protein [Candidatus Zixiibacteriota bacterium]|nr:MAG: glycosyltransferase family 4 protein [candidate division Zixibacteria bacterium]
MKILALNWNDLKNPYAGGAEVHLEELLRRLAGFGHDITLFCSGFKGCLSEETVEGIRIIRRGNRYSFNLIAPFHLRKLVRHEKFDILVEDINKIPFYTPLYLDLKTLVVVPHLFATTVFHEINFVLGTYIYLAEKPLVPVYRGLTFNVISESTGKDIVRRGIPAGDISVIHCGIDRQLYAHDPAVSKYEVPTILYLGRIKKYKSVQHLISAFKVVKAHLPDARLMVVGNGDYLGNLRSQAKSLGLENDVEFPGFVSTEEKVERMRRSHVAVLPSLKEGWGLTNIEASSVGTAVVAADSPGLRDSVRDGETGFLYEYGNIDQFADKLLAVLTDDSLRGRLEEGGLRWAEKFSWDKAARKFERLLLEVAGENSDRQS